MVDRVLSRSFGRPRPDHVAQQLSLSSPYAKHWCLQVSALHSIREDYALALFRRGFGQLLFWSFHCLWSPACELRVLRRGTKIRSCISQADDYKQ
jgi:hypothetical protein